MKKIISLLIALAMILSLFSVNVFAEDTHEHDGVVFKAWSDPTSLPTEAGNYYLAVDVEPEYTWKPTLGEVNLCLNGHGITYDGGYKEAIYLYDVCALNIYDCSEEESGTISGDDYGIYNYGTLTVNGGTISGYVYGIYNYGTLDVNSGTISGDWDGIYNWGDVTVNGGIISGEGIGIYNHYVTFYNEDNTPESLYGTVIVNDGTISGGDEGIYNNGTLTVNGGTISGDYYGIYNHEGDVTVNDGTTSGGDYGIYCRDTLTVNGGTISGDMYGIYGGNVTANGGTICGGDDGIYAYGNLYLSGDAEISGSEADIELLWDYGYLSGNTSGIELDPKYITVTGKLENTKPYTVRLSSMLDTVYDGVFTNTAPENLEFNDPTKFASAEDGYIVIKNDDGQLELVKSDDGESDGGDTNAPHAYDEDGNEIDIIVEDIDSGDEFDALAELEDVEAVAVFKITIPEGITGLLTFDIYAPGATEKSIVMIYDEWEEVENANLVVDGDRVKFTIDAELLAKYPYVAIVNAVEGEDDNPSMGIVFAVLPMLAAAAAVAVSKKR